MLARNSQPSGGRAAGNDQRLSVNGLTPDLQREGPLTQVDAIYMAELILCAEASCLLAHVLDQLWPLDSLWKTGEIFYQCGEGKLASGLVALENQRFEIGACSIEGSCVARAPGTYDDYVADVIHRSMSLGLLITN